MLKKKNVYFRGLYLFLLFIGEGGCCFSVLIKFFLFFVVFVCMLFVFGLSLLFVVKWNFCGRVRLLIVDL